MPPSALSETPEPMRFNPRPAVRPGDACFATWHNKRTGRFNPRPAVRPGDAGMFDGLDLDTPVSIRARP